MSSLFSWSVPYGHSVPQTQQPQMHQGGMAPYQGQPIVDNPTLHWTAARVHTSLGSFLVQCRPQCTTALLLEETNRLLQAHSMASNAKSSGPPVSFHPVISLRTVSGDILDGDYFVAAVIEKNHEVLALTATELAANPPPIHASFQLQQQRPQQSQRLALEQAVPHNSEKPADTVQPTTAPSASRRSAVSIFISYSWANSREAGEELGEEAKGFCDPREVRRFLSTQGFSDVWIDFERINSGDDLFEQIANGLMSSNVAVVCISDEYAQSTNCARELNFAVNVLKIPFVTLVVNGFNWQKTKVGLILGDQLYIDGTDPDQEKLSSKLHALVLSLDKIITSLAPTRIEDNELPFMSGSTSVESDESIDDGIDSVISPAKLSGGGTENYGTISDTHVDSTARYLDLQNDFKVGDILECIRWRQSRRGKLPGGGYVFRGLHWEPVKLVEILDASDDSAIVSNEGLDLYASCNMNAADRKRYKVQFDSRSIFDKKGNIRGEDSISTQIVESFMLRPCTLMSSISYKYAKYDAVEFRQFIHHASDEESGNDTSSTVLLNNDSYDLWPAYIHSELPDGVYLLKVGFGIAVSQDSGLISGALRPIHERMLRPGFDPRLYLVEGLLDNGSLFVTERGFIVHPNELESTATTNGTPGCSLKVFKEVAMDMWRPVEKPIPWNLVPAEVYISHVDSTSTTDGKSPPNPECQQQHHILHLTKYMARILASQGHRIVRSEDVLASLPSGASDETILAARAAKLIKAQVIVLCLSPEYFTSPVCQRELAFARESDLPIVCCVVGQLLKSDLESSFVTMIGHLNGGGRVLDLTCKPLITSRCHCLGYDISMKLKSLIEVSKSADADEAKLPLWKQPQLPTNQWTSIASNAVIECLVGIVRQFPISVIGSDGKIVSTSLQYVGSLVWMRHAVQFVKEMGRDSNQVAVLPEPRCIFFNVFRWATREGDSYGSQWTKGWRWGRTCRTNCTVSAPETCENLKNGDSVEIRTSFIPGSIPKLTWWPATFLRFYDRTNALVRVNNSNTDLQVDPIVKVHISQIRVTDDPRATKWWPPSLFSVEKRDVSSVSSARAASVGASALEPYLLIRNATEAMRKTAIEASHPDAKLWLSSKGQKPWSYATKPPESATKSLIAQETAPNEASRTSPDLPQNVAALGLDERLIAKMKIEQPYWVAPLGQRLSMTERLEGDPPQDRFMNGSVVVNEAGDEIHFTGDCLRRVISKFPMITRAEPAAYVEMEILDMVPTADGGVPGITIGIGARPFPPFMLPGWMTSATVTKPNSMGFNSVHGRRLIGGRADSLINGRPFLVGDIIGFGVASFRGHGNAIFTINGEIVDQTMPQFLAQNMQFLMHLIIACDGGGTCRVRLNCGLRPFAFDVEGSDLFKGDVGLNGGADKTGTAESIARSKEKKIRKKKENPSEQVTHFTDIMDESYALFHEQHGHAEATGEEASVGAHDGPTAPE